MYGTSENEIQLPDLREFGVTIAPASEDHPAQTELVRAHKMELQDGCLVFFTYQLVEGQDEQGRPTTIPVGRINRAFREWMDVLELQPSVLVH